MTAHEAPIYWLGVHKTGTTFLQACLEASRPALDQHGVQYQALDAFRAAHTRPLLDHDGTPEPVPAARPGRQLVFDENILGLVQHVAAPDGLYPEGAWRADEMADHLGLAAPRLVLGLRGFAGFLPSLYCETLKSTRFLPFRAFLRTPTERLSWQPLVAGLLDAFPGASITIYEAEKLRGHETRLLSALLGIPMAALKRADHSERPGFSQQAVDAMLRRHEAGGIDRAGVQELIKAHPRGPGAPGFDPWSPQERARLDALYATDLDALSGWSRVRLIDPASPGIAV
ncbi:hypothetical protein [Limimaricola hongkongensis]|uniref:Sulfotransferase family protein n=1 Tax=Limimaricola hongkongensis DSM 17492 TaxID=1122180 RepID=A0A017H8W5_9RHOB|nr:hypothetical protein [Limimaricola hongkongensis]EYD70553.1 hypothetical protein Lokhon_02187 [Limimaricola hongkongensis DSM 17492]